MKNAKQTARPSRPQDKKRANIFALFLYPKRTKVATSEMRFFV
jgi:hypothetical protein